VWADFNHMEDEVRLWTTLGKAESYLKKELRLGQSPELFDGLQRVSVNMTHIALCTCAISMRGLPDWPE
jgi:hypothetical protein